MYSTSLLERKGLANLREIWQKSIDASLTHGHNDGVVVNARATLHHLEKLLMHLNLHHLS